MRKLTQQELALIAYAQQYNSPEEFQMLSGGKYTIAKRKGLVNLVWPIHTCALPPDYRDPIALELAREYGINKLVAIEKLTTKTIAGLRVAENTTEVDGLLHYYLKTVDMP